MKGQRAGGTEEGVRTTKTIYERQKQRPSFIF